MTTQFTSGPWYHTEEPDYDGTFFAVRNNRGYLIATTSVHDLAPDREGNARLIASAPALYEALKEALVVLEANQLDPLGCENIRAALSQAEGK